MKLTKEQLVDYLSGLLDVRKLFNIPANKYYSVATYPKEKAGTVEITGDRDVPVKKISKSNIT